MAGQTLVVGVFADALGHCMRNDVECRTAWAAPSHEYRSVQEGPVILDWSHGMRLGTVTALDVDDEGRAWAVGSLDTGQVLPPQTLYFSPSITGLPTGGVGVCDIELRRLALTSFPASIGLPPVRVIEGDAWGPGLSDFAVELLVRGESYRSGASLELRRWKGTRPPPGMRIEYSAPVGRVLHVAV